MTRRSKQMQRSCRRCRRMRRSATLAAAQAAAARRLLPKPPPPALTTAREGKARVQQGQWAGGKTHVCNNKANERQAQGGPNQAGIGAGYRTYKSRRPTAQAGAPSPGHRSGKILASTLIRPRTSRAESKVGVANVAAPPEQDATDEIEQGASAARAAGGKGIFLRVAEGFSASPPAEQPAPGD